jgi:hypothetical protein
MAGIIINPFTLTNSNLLRWKKYVRPYFVTNSNMSLDFCCKVDLETDTSLKVYPTTANSNLRFYAQVVYIPDQRVFHLNATATGTSFPVSLANLGMKKEKTFGIISFKQSTGITPAKIKALHFDTSTNLNVISYTSVSAECNIQLVTRRNYFVQHYLSEFTNLSFDITPSVSVDGAISYVSIGALSGMYNSVNTTNLSAENFQTRQNIVGSNQITLYRYVSGTTIKIPSFILSIGEHFFKVKIKQYLLQVLKELNMVKGAGGYATFLIEDVTTGLAATGKAGTLTMYVVKDGSAATQTTNTATEVSSTNTPGLYRVQLTESESNANEIAVAGKSTDPNLFIHAVFIHTTPNTIQASLTNIENTLPEGSKLDSQRLSSVTDLINTQLDITNNADASKTEILDAIAVVDGLVDTIYSKLPTNNISDLNLNDLIDGSKLKTILALMKANICNKYVANSPNIGDLTFYKNDGSSVLTKVNVTTTGRTRSELNEL